MFNLFKFFKLPSTLTVFYTLLLTGGAWEAKTIVDDEEGNTFSATIRELGEAQTFVPFSLGAVGGHLCQGASLKFKLAYLCGILAGLFFWPLVDKAKLKELKGAPSPNDSAATSPTAPTSPVG